MFCYINCYYLLVRDNVVWNKIYFFDMFDIQLSLDGAWIFEMWMECKCNINISTERNTVEA